MSRAPVSRLWIVLILVFSAMAVQGQTCTAPSITIYQGQNPTCDGEFITLDAGSGWTTYSWSNGATGQQMTDTPHVATAYTVTVTDANGCTATSQPLTIGVAARPAGPEITAPSAVQPGVTATASVTMQPEWGSVSWEITGGWFYPPYNYPTASGGDVTFQADGSGPVVLRAQAYLGMYDTCSLTEKTILTVPLGYPSENPELIVTSSNELCEFQIYDASLAPTEQWQNAYWTIQNGVFEYPQYPYQGTTASGLTVRFRPDHSGLPVVLTVDATKIDNSTLHASRPVSLRQLAAPQILTTSESTCDMGVYDATIAAPPSGSWQNAYWTIQNGVFMTTEYPYQSTTASGLTVHYRSNAPQSVVLTVRATDGSGCETPEGTKTIPRRTIAAPEIVTNTDSTCEMGVYDATLAVPAEGTWQSVYWTIENGVFLRNEYPYEATYANGLNVRYRSNSPQAVVLSVNAMDSLGCYAPPATKSVPRRTIAAPQIVTSTEFTCEMGVYDATLAAPAAGTWQSVYWTIQNGVFLSNEYPYEATYANGLNVRYRSNSPEPVVLRVNAMDSLGCYSPEGTKTISRRTIAAPQIVTSTELTCEMGMYDATVAAPAEGTWQSVYWNIQNGVFMNNEYPYESTYANGPNVRFRSNSPEPVVLTVNAMDSFGCYSPQATKSIGRRSIAAPVIVTSSPAVCANAATSATVEAPAEGSWQSMSWSITNGAFQTPDYPYTSPYAYGLNVTFVANGNGPVTLSVNGTDSYGCYAPNGTKEVPLGGGTVDITTAASVCGPVPTPATIAAGTWESVTWTILGGTFDGGATSASGPSVIWTANPSASSVELNVTANDPNGCSVTGVKTVPVVIGAAVFTAPDAVCASGPGTVQADPGYTNLQWSFTNAIWQNGYGNSVYFTPTGTGPVTFTIEANDANGCRYSGSKTIALNTTMPQISAPAGPICAFTPYSATVTNAAAFTSVSWWIEGGYVDSPNAATTQFTANNSQTPVRLHVSGYFADGCFNESVVSISLSQPPSTVITGSGNLCPGATETLTAPDGASWLWSTGATTRSIDVTAAGHYQVTTTNAAGCTSVASKDVVAIQLAAPTITSSNGTSFCATDGTLLTAQAGYDAYQWSNGSTSPSIIVFDSGTYTVFAAKNNCNVSSSITVTSYPKPVVTASATTHCAGGEPVTLTSTEATSYLWSNGATTRSIEVTSPGTYWVRTTIGGCTELSNDVVIADGGYAPPLWITLDNATYCPGATGTATAQNAASFTEFEWSITNGTLTSAADASSVTFTAGTAGNVTLTVRAKSAAGCWRRETIDAGVSTPIAAFTLPAAICNNTGTNVSVPDAGAGATYAWSVTNGTILQDNGAAMRFKADVAGPVSVTVTVTKSGGCSTTHTATTNADELAIQTITVPAVVCDRHNVTATVADPPAGATFTWTLFGATLVSGSSLNDRSITFDVDTNLANLEVLVQIGSCSYRARSSVAVAAAPAISVVGSEMICGPGSITLRASGGSDYAWSNGMTGQEITVTSTTTLTVTATTQGGCRLTSAPQSVTVSLPAVPQIVAPASICPRDETITATLANASAYSEYIWHTSSNLYATSGNSVTLTRGLMSGDAWVEVIPRDLNGCWAAATRIVIPELPMPDATITTDAAYCSGGTYEASVPDAGAGATYDWDLTNATIVSGEHARTVRFTAGTNTVAVFVTVNGTNGCFNQNLRNVPVTQPVNVSITAPAFVCSNAVGQTASATDAGAGATYVWTATNATITGGQGTAAITYDVTGSSTVTLSLIVTKGACTSNTSANVAIVDAPSFGIGANAGGGQYDSRFTTDGELEAQTTAEFCGASSANLLATVLDPSWTYTWSTGANGPFLNVTTSGTYTLTATNTNGCSSTSSITVNFKPAPQPVISGLPSFCPGGSTTLTASGGDSYLWSTGATTASLTVNEPGTYTVTATTNGCSASRSVEVSENAASIAVSGPATFCAGGDVVLTAAPAQSYLWSNGATTRSITVTTSGSYSVSETFASGCTLAAAPVNVMVGPSAVSIALDDTSACPGQALTATSSVTGGTNVSYQWLDESGNAIPGATGPSYTFVPAQPAYGHLSLRVSDATGCMQTSNTATYYRYTVPQATISVIGPTAFCSGTGVTLSASNGTAYLWSSGQTTPSIYATEAGTYTVTVTDNTGCATTSEPVTLTMLPAAAKPSITGATTFCDGTSTTLTATDGYTSYAWSNGMTGRTITLSDSTTVFVTATDANGCSATSDGYVVTENAVVAKPTITGAQTFCNGTSTTLTASAGYASYAWSNGMTGASITVSDSATLTVTATDANGCSATSDPYVVTENAVVAKPTITGVQTFCNGTSTTLTATDGYTSYAWSNGMTGASITVSDSATLTVTATDANGCSATSDSYVVTENAVVAKPTISGAQTFCNGTSTTLTASAGYASYAWSNGMTGASITVQDTIIVTVTATNSNGCSATSDAFTTTERAALTKPSISGPSSFCPGTTATLTAPAGYVSYVWSNGMSGASITVSAAATYTVTVTDANGCSIVSNAFTLSQYAATGITTQPQSISIRKNTAASISVVATAAGAPTYQWYRGNSGDTSNPVTSGGNAASLSVGTPSKGTYRYWVRVGSTTCPTSTVNSTTATVTVTN
ncbi:MAG TPA: hypothetical protein VHW00_01385 [Thermoanaerobaculia bacterium]|nr:hypothetical protein [Thermoanaerobaculia bacterium]